MASGDFLFEILPKMVDPPPTTNFATEDVFAAATGFRHVLDFAGSGADETAIFPITWPEQYDGGGVTVVMDYSTDGTVTNAIQIEISFEVVQDADDQDAGGQDFGTLTDITDAPSATPNQNGRASGVNISHAFCGSPVSGDRGRIKLTRDFNHLSNSDDVQFHRLYITEQ